jgi:cell division protease FtsH
MVTQYGMTETLGAIKLGGDSVQPFLGREYGHQRDYSESVAAKIDAEIRKMIENAHQEAFDILVANRESLDAMVVVLLEEETINKEEIAEIFKNVVMWPERPKWTGSLTRIPSDIPPVAITEKLQPVVEEEESAKPKRARRVKKATDSE